MFVRGIRGAITIEQNSSEEIVDNTEMLVREIIQKNQINPEHIVSILISVTEDISADFPAKAMRRFDGFTYVPVMCVREIPVPGSLPLCIRIMMTVHTELSQRDVKHIYLKGALSLRPDL